MGHMLRTALKITLDCESDDTFVLVDGDLVMTRRVTPQEALSGYTSVVVLPGGGRVAFQCVDVLHHGAVVTVLGCGLPPIPASARASSPSGTPAGDLFIVFTLHAPLTDVFSTTGESAVARLCAEPASKRAQHAVRVRGVNV
jgi:DnaJ-class molecular chaperone